MHPCRKAVTMQKRFTKVWDFVTVTDNAASEENI